VIRGGGGGGGGRACVRAYNMHTRIKAADRTAHA
jgi:hypothetical protein